jgi:hypothetical protein
MKNIEYMRLLKSDKENKRFKAVFLDENKQKVLTTHFGLKGASTFIDHNDDIKKKAYIARHSKNEDWSNYVSAGCLARYILWEHKTLTGAINSYRKRFNLK